MLDATGANARPRDTTLGQTGEDIPDDSGRPVQLGEAEAKRIEETIRGVVEAAQGDPVTVEAWIACAALCHDGEEDPSRPCER